MKAKFKVGDRVECVVGPPGTYGGCGWKLGLKFKITRISHPNSNDYIYWQRDDIGGVYEQCLELYESKIKPFGIVKFCETYYV